MGYRRGDLTRRNRVIRPRSAGSGSKGSRRRSAPQWPEPRDGAPRSGRFAPCAHPTAPRPEYVGAARRRQPSGGSVLFHAAQVLEVTRKTRDLHTNRWRAVTVYAITSLSHAQASPARLADLLRNHWAIEALHHLRDVTFAEDACKVRTGSGPHVMATLRNLVIGVLCRAGPGQRHRRATPPRPRPSPRPLATLGIDFG